ncbi:hypothetical protein C1646_793802 [Rhizophagus diaphanus]|nr:hypothetical protein C1646_793802 [Rhizophagus diaphanus] [Rhizophagus sp. MUCL 43196]
MVLIFHSNLSKDLSKILNDSNDFNVIIQVGENQNIKEFRAHSVILSARSTYFKSALSTNWITKRNNMFIFNKPNITPIVFEMILKYIYTGELDLTEQKSEDILELLVASDEMLFEELFEHLQDYLINKREAWIKNNYVLVLNSIYNLVSCKELQWVCFDFICANVGNFIISKNFLSLNKDSLYRLFELDNFHIQEIVAWDSLIEWGIKQMSKNNHNKNYESLKNMLEDFIPFIKFTKITSEDFYHKVRPYKYVIPNDIYEEVIAYYFIEQPKFYSNISVPRIESKIIKPKLANIIVNWIDEKDAETFRTEKDLLYKFNLIYRGSRDGIDNESFKNEWNDNKKTLVLIKVKQSNKIFGGYNSDGCSSTKNSSMFYGNYYGNFIFSFENNEDTRYIKFSRNLNSSKTIYDGDITGFNFCWDALFGQEQDLCINNFYLDNVIEEIETFTIISAFLERLII